MDTEKLFLSVKKDIRSLLISSKHGCSPETLRRDYHNMLGHPMPLKLLGFRSVLEMVKEMPDVVHLNYALDGTILLRAIGDKTTKGIEELVSKQRNQKHKSNRFINNPKLFVLPRRGHNPPALPAQLRSQLRQLLAHGSLRLSELERCYAVRFGRPLNVMNYGFYSITEMLTAASDIVTIRQTRVGSELTLKTEISSVKQKHNTTAAEISTSTALFSNSEPEDQQNPKHIVAARAKEGKPATVLMQGKSFEKAVAKLEEEFRKRILESGESGTVSQELKDNLRKVVSRHSQGIAIHDLHAQYKKMFNEELPLAQSGFLNVTEMVGALSDMFYVQQSQKKDKKDLFIMELKPNDQPGTLILWLFKWVAAQCRERLCKYSWAAGDYPSTAAWHIEGHYFSCSEMSWECQNNEWDSTETLESDPPIKMTSVDINQAVTILPVQTVQSRVSVVPLDALQCQKLKPPTCRRFRELVPVIVERIESPSHFYIRFSEDQQSCTLENMMFEMRSCYSCPEVAKRYRLLDAYVRPGQVCCVAPEDTWFYRVVIHRLLSSTEVEVYYVDFGDLNVVSRGRLQFLKSCYAELSAQAVPSVLAGVRPVKGDWTEESTRLFQKLCSDRTLVAAVHSYQHDFLLIYLCDTHTEEDLYVHTALQAEGHAIACDTADSLVLHQFSPVTLYLGYSQLREVKEHFAAMNFPAVINRPFLTEQAPPDSPTICGQHSTHGVDNQQYGQEMAPLDLPELEFIQDDDQSVPFKSLVKKDPEIFDYWDQGLANEASTVKDSKLVQDCQAESANTEPGMFIKPEVETQPVLESKHTQQLESSVHILEDQTSNLISSCSYHTDMSAELFQPRPSSLIFSLFSSSDKLAKDAFFVRHMPIFALGPSARMAAGSSFLHWYTQTGLK